MRRIIGFDPGKKSAGGKHTFAYAINDGKCNVLDSDYIETTLDAVNPYELEDYRIEMFCLLEWMDVSNDDIFIIERFIPRPGRSMGAAAEYINLMIGILVDILLSDFNISPDNIINIMPSVWKTRFKKEYDGKLPPDIYPEENGLDSHKADAFGMTEYFLLREADLFFREINKEFKRIYREIKKYERNKKKIKNAKK